MSNKWTLPKYRSSQNYPLIYILENKNNQYSYKSIHVKRPQSLPLINLILTNKSIQSRQIIVRFKLIGILKNYTY